MGFSRGFGSRDTPRTFAACQKVWNDASDRKKAKGYLILGANTNLFYSEHDGGHYYAEFHNHRIVTFYPEFKVIDACRHEGSPTTQVRISALTGCHMTQNSSLGYHQSTRVNGFPYFDGMRIDNHGRVFEEDQKPDFKTVNVKAVVQRYTSLFRRIEKLILGRYELGEWAALEPYNPTVSAREALSLLETLIAEGETFLPFRLIRALLPYHADNETPLRDLLKRVKEEHRDAYYRANDGCIDIEVI